MPDLDTRVRVGSVCSGVGGFELGLHRADPRFDVRWACEWDPRRREVLRRHMPDVPVHPDIKELRSDDLEPIDLLVGGTPCQDLSVAGKRAGLEGDESVLFWHYVRLRNELEPEWCVWENVPGAFSSHDGMDFALVLGAFLGAPVSVPTGGWTRAGVAAGPWGGVAWRTLNSQHFGVPQRRHRVFVVGRLGGPCPPEVLLDLARGAGDPAEGGEAQEGAAGGAEGVPRVPGVAGPLGGLSRGAGHRSTDLDGTGAFVADGADGVATSLRGSRADEHRLAEDVAPTLRANGSRDSSGKPGNRTDAQPMVVEAPETAATLTSCGNAESRPNRRKEDDDNLAVVSPPVTRKWEKGTGGPAGDEAQNLVGFPANGGNRAADESHEDAAPTVKGGEKHGGPAVAAPLRGFGHGWQGQHNDDAAGAGMVRRLTPTECERLQGFPDGWTIVDGPSLLDAPSHYHLEGPPEWEPITFEWQAGGHGDESWGGKSRLYAVDKPGRTRALRSTSSLAVFTKRHGANHPEDYESWEEAEVSRTIAGGGLAQQSGASGALVAERACPHGDPACPCQDGDPCHYENLPGSPAMRPPAYSVRTAQHGANGIGVDEEVAPTADETGAGAVAKAFLPRHFTRGKDGAPDEVAPPLLEDSDRGDGMAAVYEEPVGFDTYNQETTGDTAHTLRDGVGGRPDVQPHVAEAAPALRTQQRNNSTPAVEADMTVTDGADELDAPEDPPPDGFRYAAMGDAVTVPVISWIGARLAAAMDELDPDTREPMPRGEW